LKLTVTPKVREAFPKLSIKATIARGVRVGRVDGELRALIERGVGEVRERYGGDPSKIRSLSSLRIYDDLLKRTGEDKVRSSVESMIRRLARGDPFPSINNLVDLCNLVLVQTMVAVGAFDLDKLVGDVALRVGEKGESQGSSLAARSCYPIRRGSSQSSPTGTPTGPRSPSQPETSFSSPQPTPTRGLGKPRAPWGCTWRSSVEEGSTCSSSRQRPDPRAPFSGGDIVHST
jgi:hypothetical protein